MLAIVVERNAALDGMEPAHPRRDWARDRTVSAIAAARVETHSAQKRFARPAVVLVTGQVDTLVRSVVARAGGQATRAACVRPDVGLARIGGVGRIGIRRIGYPGIQLRRVGSDIANVRISFCVPTEVARWRVDPNILERGTAIGSGRNVATIAGRNRDAPRQGAQGEQPIQGLHEGSTPLSLQS